MNNKKFFISVLVESEDKNLIQTLHECAGSLFEQASLIEDGITICRYKTNVIEKK